MRFALRSDIINYWDISLLAFHNNWDINFIINVYSDNSQTALQCLCHNIMNIGNTVIMTSDFNIRDSDWDPNFYNHFIHTEDLTIIADSLGLKLFPSSNPGPTRYANNLCDSNSVLDLVFLPPRNSGFSQHSLHLELRKPSNYISLIIEVSIKEVNTDITIRSIKKDSDEKK